MKNATTTFVAIFLICAAEAIEYKVEKDIPYYPQAALAQADAYKRERCVLDVKWPVGETNFPTVVNFHGGGLVHGSKHFAPWPEGPGEPVAFVGVNYRLIDKATPAECLSDAGAAVAWVLDNIARYGGDPKKVFVTGISGGGYLTAMVGMDARWLAPWGHKPSDLAGIAPLTGQMTKHFNVRKVGFKDEDPQFAPKIDEWAPLFYAGAKGLPPAAFLAGGRDLEWKCRVEENELLAASLRNCGYPNTEFHETEGSHGGGVKPSAYFLRDFVMKYSGAGMWRFAAGERAAVHGEGAEPVAAALQLFEVLRHPGMGVRVSAGNVEKGAREITVRGVSVGVAGAYAEAARIFEKMREWPMVAQASLSAKTGKVWQRANKKKPETMNAVVSAVSVRKGGVAFTYAPKALPFPATDAFRVAAAECPFLGKLNRELIVVDGLAKGEYSLSFDGREVGRFTADTFAKGVDVALLDTPNQRLSRAAAELAERLSGAAPADAEDIRESLDAVRPIISRVVVAPAAK